MAEALILDLTEDQPSCAQEPIHIPGTIQPHGALVVLDPDRDMAVVAASANIARFLPEGLPGEGIVPGGKLGDLLGREFCEHLQTLLETEGFRSGTPWEMSIQARGGCPELEASVHLQAGLVLVELEVLTFQDVYETLAATRILQRSTAQLQRTTGDLGELASVVVSAVRLLTGYERVLIYKFDQDQHGQVLAEDKVSDWDQSLSGQRSHASNIPPQAWKLYLLAPLRCMWDRDATPVPLHVDPDWAGSGATGRAIDLSYAKLRSVSPTHLAIHRALGIDGMMSLSLIQDGELWGLIVCHHRQPHLTTPGQQAAAMALANAFAVRVGPAERAQIEQARRADAQRLGELLANMAAAEDAGLALTSGKVTIASLFNATGAAVLHDGKTLLVGSTPPEVAVLELAIWLRNHDGDVFQTDRLPSLYPSWVPHAPTACGIVAVFLAADRSEMLLWFRRAETPLVDSDTTLNPEQAAALLQQASFKRVGEPRHAFARPWAAWELEIAAALGHAVTEVIIRSLRRIANVNERLRQLEMLETARQAQIGLTMRQANEMLRAKVQAQQAQQATEAELQFASQAGGLGIWKLELGTNELTASDMCKNNFGRNRGIPFTYNELLNAARPDDRERMIAAVHRSTVTGANHEIELAILRPSGAAGWVQMQAQVVYAGDGTVASLVGISLDITERVLMQERVRQSQKIEAIGRLTAGIAHDFNNVLQALLGGIEIAIDEVADRPEVCASLELSLQAGQRGARLTSHLLSFSRQQILRPAPLDLSPLLENLSRTLMRTLGHDIAVRIEIASNLPYVLADAAHLDAALLNLALNARDAMVRGGELRIAAHARNGHIVIAVTDTGEGMTSDVLVQACEPFFSTKGLKGSGLGLSMVQGFARQSGGELNIRSVPGQGTRIEISLPSAVQATLPGPVARAQSVRGHGRVLVVDDEADVGRVVGVFLRKAGFEVVSVADANTALYELGAGLPFDALVTDYAMPGMNGADLVLCARETHPVLPALIITGYAGAEGLDTLPPGVVTLRKPFQREDLTHKVKELVENKDSAWESLGEID